MSENNKFELNINAKNYIPMNKNLRQKEEQVIKNKENNKDNAPLDVKTAKPFIPKDMRKKANIRVGDVYLIKHALAHFGIPNANHTCDKQCVIGHIDNENVYIYLLNSHMSPAAQKNTEYQKNYISIFKCSFMEINQNFKVKKSDFLKMMNDGQITCIGVCNEDDLKKIQQAVNTDMLKKTIERHNLKQSIKKMKNGEINPYYPQYNQQYNDYYGYNQMYNTSNMYGNNQYNNYYPGY